MATITRTAHWTLLADLESVLQVLPKAVKQATFNVKSVTPDEIVVDVPRAILKDRWAAKITGTFAPSGDRTHVEWRIEGLGNRHYEHLVKISKGLPEGLLDDHGIPAAAGQDYRLIFGLLEVSHLANILERDERVNAIGVGHLGNKNGLAAATSRRLLFLEKGFTSESLTSFSIQGIQGVNLKKSTGGLISAGETLTISHSGATAVITKLAHGQGDALVRAIREAQEALVAPQPQPTAQPAQDLVGQLERLAGLRDQGVLTDEEFQQQKAILLNR